MCTLLESIRLGRKPVKIEFVLTVTDFDHNNLVHIVIRAYCKTKLFDIMLHYSMP